MQTIILETKKGDVYEKIKKQNEKLQCKIKVKMRLLKN